MSATQILADVYHQNALGYMLSGNISTSRRALPQRIHGGSKWNDTHLVSGLLAGSSSGGKRLLFDKGIEKMSPFKHGILPYAKRLKASSPKTTKASDLPLLCNNPVLLEKISNLGGGFPMPKWSIEVQKERKDESFKVREAISKDQSNPLPSTRLGAFPMPTISGRPTLVSDEPRLSSFRELWE